MIGLHSRPFKRIFDAVVIYVFKFFGFDLGNAIKKSLEAKGQKSQKLPYYI